MGAGGRRDLKSKAATASVRVRGILAARKKEATSSTSPSQGFGILKKRKEAMAAQDLYELEDVPGGLDTWKDRWLEMKAKIDEEEEAAAATPPAKKKKRKRVVKQRFPKSLIEHLVATPFSNVEDLTPDQLAKRSRKYRQLHAMTEFVDGKMRDYEHALIDQYNAQGYAEDETEVTESDEDVTAEN